MDLQGFWGGATGRSQLIKAGPFLLRIYLFRINAYFASLLSEKAISARITTNSACARGALGNTIFTGMHLTPACLPVVTRWGTPKAVLAVRPLRSSPCWGALSLSSLSKACSAMSLLIFSVSR